MFFKIDKPKIVAGLKNFFNWRSNSNNRNQTVHIENLTINLYQQPGGAVPEGQIGIQVEPRVETDQQEGTSGEGAQPPASIPVSQAPVGGVRRRNWEDWEEELMLPLLIIYQKLGIGDLFNLLLEGIRAQDHPVHGAWARTREQMLEYLYNRTRRG